MSEVNLYVIDKDCCPNQDNIIVRMQCSECEYYRGFDMYNGQPCIKCDFYGSVENPSHSE